MYRFVIKSITGEILYTSGTIRDKVLEVQEVGMKFLNNIRDWNPDAPISTKGNYVDVI